MNRPKWQGREISGHDTIVAASVRSTETGRRELHMMLTIRGIFSYRYKLHQHQQQAPRLQGKKKKPTGKTNHKIKEKKKKNDEYPAFSPFTPLDKRNDNFFFL
jgi:hypothetical protein